MADMRKVLVMPVNSEDYPAWVNFDRVLYIEGTGVGVEGVPISIMVFDEWDVPITEGNQGKVHSRECLRVKAQDWSKTNIRKTRSKST